MAVTSQADAHRFDHHRGSAPLLRQTSIFHSAFFVAANLAGFIAANAFVHYLATGRWFDFSLACYRKSLVTPLNEMMVRPLSIFAYPWMIAVSGLLVAAVAFVPVMVALLYRLRTSMLFVLAVLVLAHAPLMAACLAAGCILAAKTRLRSDLPFLALMLGLFPVAAYLALFSLGTGHLLKPLQRAAILLPFVFAMAAALTAGAAVLKLARLAKYRPGVIWPVLLVIVGAPIWLFYQKVGPSELDYALIAARVRPGGEYFVPESVGDYRRRLPARRPAAASRRSTPEQDGGEATPGELLLSAADFLKRHGGDPRGAAVMWLRAAAMEAQIRRRAAEAGTVAPASAPASAPTSAPAADPTLAELHRAMARAWEDLADEYADSPPAMVARARQGVEALRDGRVQRALVHLRRARRQLTAHLEAAGAEAGGQGGRVFSPPAPMPGDEYYRAVSADVDKLIWLMSANKVVKGSRRNRNAFREYMRSWPFTDASLADLRALATGYEGTELADNFHFLAAMAEEKDIDRAVALRPLAEEVKDAAIAANYQLGRLAMKLGHTPAWRVMKLKTAREYFKIVEGAVKNPYQPMAAEHLKWLQRR